MASLYGSKVTEGGMTLELSLEINKKLQVRFFVTYPPVHLFKLSGSARGHSPEEHHLEGEPEHLGRGGQQDGDRETQRGRQAKLQGQAQGERTIGGVVIVNADCDIVINVKFRIFCFQRVAISILPNRYQTSSS